MIDKNRTYRTRNGYEVRIYATDGGHVKCVHGAYSTGDGFWVSTTWTAEGKRDSYSACNAYDLIEVRPRHRKTVWLNVSDGHCWVYPSREKADASPSMLRIACIKVDLDFAEGDGL